LIFCINCTLPILDVFFTGFPHFAVSIPNTVCYDFQK